MVVPHAGTWIEMWKWRVCSSSSIVVPHAGTWIEICIRYRGRKVATSFPTRERGLKFIMTLQEHHLEHVVPHAGTWIEISDYNIIAGYSRSFPTRERGLKLVEL